MARSQDPRTNGPRLESTQTGVRLCSTCRHDAGCTLRGEKDLPALYCEEFEVDTVAGSAAEPRPTRAQMTSRSDLQGLCGNCLNRETCQLAGCEGGIWHCEEYQ